MDQDSRLLRVAVPVPLAEGFDYVWTGTADRPAPGSRVRVPFGKAERIGIVLSHPASTELATAKLKPAFAALDSEPIIDIELMRSLAWAAGYYHHPIGEVLSLALPGLLRKGRPPEPAPVTGFELTDAGMAQEASALAARAGRQAEALALLCELAPVALDELKRRGVSSAALKRLEDKGWIRRVELAAATTPSPAPRAGSSIGNEPWPELTEDQHQAVSAVRAHQTGFACFLLHGITGSGKTEVFLQLIRRELENDKQTLLLVPEISLTPQLVGRLEARFGDELAVFHSGLTDSERLSAWHRTRTNAARLIVGTRSAVFAPLKAPGLIIIDEEHDPSFKQQQGFRYSARDLAIVRARTLEIPILLASATPSLESFRNASEGRYRLLQLPKRIGAGGQPDLRVIDLNRHAERQGLSTPLVAAMDAHLARGNQVLLFINRRGFAPVLFCPKCEKAEECSRCDARMTVHARAGELRCHHCGRQNPLHWACPECGSERIGVGAGTQRITDELKAMYPELEIARLDRDAIGGSGALGEVLARVESGKARIIVGTQMLTKGHDFPDVTLVGVLNADQGLFGTDFRSEERLAQTIVQVAGRAGRRDRSGEVLIQTHYPDHPLLGCLLTRDYAAFAELALAERRQTGWPPYSHIALWRAEAPGRPQVFAFLDKLAANAGELPPGTRILGPTAEWMERRSGRYRAQLLVQSDRRSDLHQVIGRSLGALRGWAESRRVRWSIDVDPYEL